MKLLLAFVFVGLLAAAYGTIITSPVSYHGLNSWGNLGSRYVVPVSSSNIGLGLSHSVLTVPSSYSVGYRTVPSVYGLGSNYGLNVGYGLNGLRSVGGLII